MWKAENFLCPGGQWDVFPGQVDLQHIWCFDKYDLVALVTMAFSSYGHWDKPPKWKSQGSGKH